jgi:hypothetical protein
MEKHHFLVSSSCLTLFSVYYAYIYHHTICCLLTFIIFLTSINYHRNPVHGIRRKIDQTFIVITLITQTTILQNQKYYILYNIFNCVGLSCYCFSKFFKNTWTRVYLHSMLHVFGNVANIIGYIN